MRTASLAARLVLLALMLAVPAMGFAIPTFKSGYVRMNEWGRLVGWGRGWSMGAGIV